MQIFQTKMSDFPISFIDVNLISFEIKIAKTFQVTNIRNKYLGIFLTYPIFD